MKPVFVYCSYWGTWSRRLWAKNGEYIELDLMPIPCCHSSTWDKISREKIRSHCTSRKANEYLGPNLPAEIREIIEANLGTYLANRMLTHDYLAEISPEEIKTGNRKSNGGGVPFEVLKKMITGEIKYHQNL